jgi:hypothetical protein
VIYKNDIIRENFQQFFPCETYPSYIIDVIKLITCQILKTKKLSIDILYRLLDVLNRIDILTDDYMAELIEYILTNNQGKSFTMIEFNDKSSIKSFIEFLNDSELNIDTIINYKQFIRFLILNLVSSSSYRENMIRNILYKKHNEYLIQTFIDHVIQINISTGIKMCDWDPETIKPDKIHKVMLDNKDIFINDIEDKITDDIFQLDLYYLINFGFMQNKKKCIKVTKDQDSEEELP